MYENFNGSSSHRTKRAQNVASWFSAEPVDCISFGDDNECLEKKNKTTEWMSATLTVIVSLIDSCKCKGNRFAGDWQMNNNKKIQTAVSMRINLKSFNGGL